MPAVQVPELYRASKATKAGMTEGNLQYRLDRDAEHEMENANGEC